jgi:hypothetical protein
MRASSSNQISTSVIGQAVELSLRGAIGDPLTEILRTGTPVTSFAQEADA